MKMDGKEFGSCMHVSAFALIGDVDEQKCFLVDREIIDAIGMHLTGLSPTVWKFPTVDGKGGEGSTIVESLTESFVGWDC